MTNDEESLFLDNQNLAYNLAWKNYNKFQKFYNIDDLKSVAILGLAKAVTTFDTNLGNAFTTYAYKVINNEIFMYIRNENKHKTNISLFEKIGNDLELQDIIKDDYDLLADLKNLVELSELDKAIESLDDRYKKIVKYYLQGMTQKQIGQEIGLSQSQVARLFNRALNMLRYRLRFLMGGYYE